MAAELGLDYNHIPISYDDPKLKQPDFLALNPAGAIPTIVDDGFVLSESLAINLYLAKRYGTEVERPLYPTDLDTEADVWQWTLWAQGHLEPWVQRDRLLVELRIAIGNQADIVVQQALNVLNRALEQRAWLIAEHFTVGDLNVAAVLSPSRSSHLDLSDYNNVVTWLEKCYKRPAAIETRRRYQT